MQNITTQWRRATQFFRKIYLSLYWKGCVWEGVRDRTELQHIDPYSYGHNSVSFPFSCPAQPVAWGPSLSGTCSSFQHLFSNWSELQLLNRGSYRPLLLGAGFLYRILSPTTQSSCGRHKSHSFSPSTVKVIFWYSLTGCTCYLHRFISYFDSLAGVNITR